MILQVLKIIWSTILNYHISLLGFSVTIWEVSIFALILGMVFRVVRGD